MVAALVADPFLDLLDVSPEPFRFAAGAVMAPLGVRLLLTGDSMPVPRPEDQVGRLWWLLPVAFPLLANPPAIVGAMSYSTRFGEGDAIGGAAIALALSAVVLAAGAVDSPGDPASGSERARTAVRGVSHRDRG